MYVHYMLEGRRLTRTSTNLRSLSSWTDDIAHTHKYCRPLIVVTCCPCIEAADGAWFVYSSSRNNQRQYISARNGTIVQQTIPILREERFKMSIVDVMIKRRTHNVTTHVAIMMRRTVSASTVPLCCRRMFRLE